MVNSHRTVQSFVGRLIAVTTAAGIQWLPRSRNPHPVARQCRQWHGREGAYITVNDRRILYDTEEISLSQLPQRGKTA